MKPIIYSHTLILVVLLLSATSASARIIRVPQNQATVQTGIDSSWHGDTVLVSPGTYRENISFHAKRIMLAGVYLLNQDENAIDATIIDGGDGGKTIQMINCGRAQLYGLSVRNGVSDYGAGVYIDNSRVQATAIHVSEANQLRGAGLPTGTGGGIYCTTGAQLVLERSTITHCYSTWYGGGLGVFQSSATINDCQFYNNESAHSGGGLHFFESTGVLTGVTIEGNRTELGAGLLASASTVEINTSTITRNSTTIGGSAFYVKQATLRVNASTIVENPCQHTEYYSDLLVTDWGENPDNVKSDVYVYNSIFWHGAVRISPGTGRVTFGYCDIDIAELRDLFGGDSLVNMTEGNIDADPCFRDSAHSDYRLTGNSPCLDAADPLLPFDPDGTRADLGPFYFHQRDITVEPHELSFPPIRWGEVSSNSITITNEGGTPLHLLEILTPMNGNSITPAHIGLFEPPVEILPSASYRLLVTYRPGERIAPADIIAIRSDDPDEPNVMVFANGNGSDPSASLHSSKFTLYSAHPNPFNSSTTIQFTLSTQTVSSEANLRVFGLNGRLVDEMALGRVEAGEHSVIWNAEGLPGGIYLLRLERAGEVKTMKLLLLR